MTPVLTAQEVTEYLIEVFPQIEGRYRFPEITDEGAIAELVATDDDLRPGGTVSGPTLFELADCAFYAATLSRIGRKALAVTTSATINFMRKPPKATLVAEARILKLGARLCVGDVTIRPEGSDEAVAHASMTYSIPPTR